MRRTTRGFLSSSWRRSACWRRHVRRHLPTTWRRPPTRQATPTTGTAPLVVVFDSSGSSDTDGTIASVAWDFGDGATSTAANPTHTYTTAGSYDATLTVTDDDGATGTDTVTIVVTEEPNVAPTAVANATPSSGRFPLTVALSSAGSSDTDGTIVAYSWNFGDGTGNSADANPTHTYANPGSYTATLTVTDDDGATGEATVVVSVTPNVAPTAVAVGSAHVGSVPADRGLLVGRVQRHRRHDRSYDWDFGDGGSSTAANPTYTYTQPGSFTATLTVTDNDGATDDATVSISRHGGRSHGVVHEVGVQRHRSAAGVVQRVGLVRSQPGRVHRLVRMELR